jgi:DNA-binding transcriptional ArsR family regulator
MTTSDPAPSPAPTPAAGPRPPLERILPAIASATRWRILRELLKEPLPVYELARRLGYTESAMSKQMTVLYDAGLIRRGYGGLYSIMPQYLVPGGKALDLGHALLRLD